MNSTDIDPITANRCMCVGLKAETSLCGVVASCQTPLPMVTSNNMVPQLHSLSSQIMHIMCQYINAVFCDQILIKLFKLLSKIWNFPLRNASVSSCDIKTLFIKLMTRQQLDFDFNLVYAYLIKVVNRLSNIVKCYLFIGG